MAGIIKAAPIPSIIEFPIISQAIVGDKEVMSEPSANKIAPITNIFLRPKRSPSLPPVTVNAAKVSE